MMFNAADDDDFFTPANNSNLASLFGPSVLLPNNISTDLTYSAPKQPKPIVGKDQSKVKEEKLNEQQSSVLYAKPVELYKTNDGSYVSVGKYGLALIGVGSRADEILLYKDKRNILTRSKISQPNFEFSLQNDAFVSFVDNNNQLWSMCFESANDLNDFIDEIQLRGVKVTNRVQNESRNVDNNKKTENTVDGFNLKAENDTDVQSESSASQARADILTRMAKMGQSILPNDVLKTKILSDSETDNSHESSKQNPDQKPKKIKELLPSVGTKEEPIERPTVTSALSNEFKPVKSQLQDKPIVTSNKFKPVKSQLVPVETSSYISPVVPNNLIMNPVSPVVDNLGFYFTENRMHNSEVRMNLSMITSKLDNVLGEITKIKFPTSTDKLENEFLKSKISDLESKNVYLSKRLELNEATSNKSYKIEEEIKLKDAEIKFKDEEIESKDAEIKSKDDEIRQLQDKIRQIKTELDEYELIRNEYDALKSNETELKKTIELQQSKVEGLEGFYEKNKNNANSQKVIDGLNEEILNLNVKLKDVEECFSKNEELKAKSKVSGQNKIKAFSDDVKQSMNAMFQTLLKDFGEDLVGRSHNEIKNILASSMKLTTYEILQHYQKSLGDINGDDEVDRDSSVAVKVGRPVKNSED